MYTVYLNPDVRKEDMMSGFPFRALGAGEQLMRCRLFKPATISNLKAEAGVSHSPLRFNRHNIAQNSHRTTRTNIRI